MERPGDAAEDGAPQAAEASAEVTPTASADAGCACCTTYCTSGKGAREGRLAV